MNVGQRVSHPIYGTGTVVKIEDSKKLGDGGWPHEKQSSIIGLSNGWSHYSGDPNVSVKFDNGGPMGFAFSASNNIKDLTEL